MLKSRVSGDPGKFGRVTVFSRLSCFSFDVLVTSVCLVADRLGFYFQSGATKDLLEYGEPT